MKSKLFLASSRGKIHLRLADICGMSSGDDQENVVHTLMDRNAISISSICRVDANLIRP